MCWELDNGRSLRSAKPYRCLSSVDWRWNRCGRAFAGLLAETCREMGDQREELFTGCCWGRERLTMRKRRHRETSSAPELLVVPQGAINAGHSTSWWTRWSIAGASASAPWSMTPPANVSAWWSTLRSLRLVRELYRIAELRGIRAC